MKIAVLIEPLAEHRFRATGGLPFPGSVEAETADAALAKLKQRIDDRLSQGARIATLDFSPGVNPWLDGAGMFRDDPLFDDWQGAIAEYRREANCAPDAP